MVPLALQRPLAVSCAVGKPSLDPIAEWSSSFNTTSSVMTSL
jgi:hypothetical protein